MNWCDGCPDCYAGGKCDNNTNTDPPVSNNPQSFPDLAGDDEWLEEMMNGKVPDRIENFLSDVKSLHDLTGVLHRSAELLFRHGMELSPAEMVFHAVSIRSAFEQLAARGFMPPSED